jgi:hypothetical protein
MGVPPVCGTGVAARLGLQTGGTPFPLWFATEMRPMNVWLPQGEGGDIF